MTTAIAIAPPVTSHIARRERRRSPISTPSEAARLRWLQVVVTRSSTIAIITIAMPPFSASPTSRDFNPSSTWRPRPGAPTTAAITTMPSAIMIVWLTPSIIEGFASGTWTFASVCLDVEPYASATSIATGETLRMPIAVSRTAGGSAKITVAISAGGAPMPKSSTAGSR